MTNEISNRWFQLKQNILNKDNILKEFNNFAEEIPKESIQKEKNIWKEIQGYGLGQIEEFLNIRLDYIDSIMKKRQNIDVNIVKKFEEINMNKNLKTMLDKDILATNVYTLGYSHESYGNLDYTKKMVN